MLGYINLTILCLSLGMCAWMYLFISKIEDDVQSIKEDANIEVVKTKTVRLQNQYKNLYESQNLPGHPAVYFLTDPYVDMSPEDRKKNITQDYFYVFKNAVDTIMAHKLIFQQDEPVLDAMKRYPYYAEVFKLAKFVSDYDTYLSTAMTPKELIQKTEKVIPGFTGQPYTIMLKSGRQVHVIYFVYNAVGVYNTYPELINRCITRKEC